MESINIEGFNWTVSVHAGWSRDKFVNLYMGADYAHIYAGMQTEQKRACLNLAWQQIDALNPVPVGPTKIDVDALREDTDAEQE